MRWRVVQVFCSASSSLGGHGYTQPARGRHFSGDAGQFSTLTRGTITITPARWVDIFLVMRGSFQPHDAPPEASLLFRHDTVQGELGASIFWVNAETSLADTEN
jgi:hypothetical protein